MADEPSGSGVSERKYLTLQEVVEAVLESEEVSDGELLGDSSLDEGSEDEEDIPSKFISDEPCSRDSMLLLDVSSFIALAFIHLFKSEDFT